MPSLGSIDWQTLGRPWGWRLTEPAGADAVAAAAAAGGPLALIQQVGPQAWGEAAGLASPQVAVFKSWPEELAPFCGLIVVSDRALPDLPAELRRRTVIYRPPTLALGVVCRRGLDAEELAACVGAFCASAGLAAESLMALALPASRKGEGSLIDFAEERALALLPYPADKLNLLRAKGAMPRKMAGLAGPAALLAAGVRELAAPPQRFSRLALAAARRAWQN